MPLWICNETGVGLNTNKKGQNMPALNCVQNPDSLYCSNAIISKNNTSMVILVALISLMDTENMDLHYPIV
jgi:hypothetical protein